MSINYDEGTGKGTQDKMEEREEHAAKNVANFGEEAEENIWDQNESKDIVCNAQNTALDVKEEQIDDSVGSDFASQKAEECNGTTSAENTKISSSQESTEHIASNDLNPCTVMKTDDESGESNGSMKNSHERPLALHLERTHHTEELVKEINVEMKTPGEAVSTTIVPAGTSIGLSEEGLLAKEIVPVCISESKLIDTDTERTKSAPSTPVVSCSEEFLRRVSSCDRFWQNTPSSPKLTFDDRIVPGSVSGTQSQEDIRPFTLKLPHAKKIVPGSISRSISDEELGSKQLQAAVVEAHEHTEQDADETSVAEKADPACTAAV
jgi:hypothetical protein